MLKSYLEDVASRFEPFEREERVNGVEVRVAGIFNEHLASPRQVVGTGMVRKAISVIGRAEDFGPRKCYGAPGQQADIRKLRRSVTDRVIGGVCGGLAQYFGLDVTLIRVLMFILIFFGGFSLWVYLVMWIVIPSGTEISY